MPGLFDTIGTNGGLLGLLTGRSGGSLAGAASPGIHQQEMEQQAQQATYQALIQAGAPEHVARAAAMNPKEFGQFAAPFMDVAPQIQSNPNPLTGDLNFYLKKGGAHPSVTAMPVAGAPGEGGISQTAGGLLSQIQQAKAAGASPEDLLKLVPVESGLGNAVKAMLRGGIVPSNFSMRGAAHDNAVKLATAIDDNFNEQELGARRKLYTDLNSSTPNSMGGILSNGKSAFGHLAELGETAADLHNYSGNDIPGSAMLAKAGNVLGNTVLASGKQSAAIARTKSPLLKYGQESTKFYAGTGGGEGERTAALSSNRPESTSSLDYAAFLKSEKNLMLERFAQKEAQIRSQLGQGYLDEKPLMGPRDKENLARIDAAIARLEGGQAAAGAPAAQSGVVDYRTYFGGK
jgi:hypothetical protein